MLIESQPQQSTTPPTPQLGLAQSMSSPSPQSTYDVIDRLKNRVNGYRIHHEISFEKNKNTIEAQNIKMKAETTRLQQQFLNNNQNNTTNSNKSKQQKSVNSSAAQRNANKRSNASANANNSDQKCDSNESKPTKVAKVANNRNSANSAAKAAQSSPNNQNFRNNCAKFPPNPQSIQIDVKMKTSMDGSSISNTNTQPLMHSNASINSIPEIKREVDDNSYFQSVTVEAIHDFLKDNSTSINGFPPNNFDCISADDIKDIFNDSNLVEDGFGPTNDGFGDEDFIKKFLEDINDSTFNEMGNTFGQHLNTNAFKSQQQPQQQSVVNHSNNMINGENNTNSGLNCNNISVNLMNNNININPNTNNMILNTNAMNSNNFIANSMQTPTNNEMTSYHPIQPRLQPNLMSNIPNRPSIQIMNPSTQPIAINHNTTIRYVNSGNTGPSQSQAPQLLLQQMPVMSQQSLNNAGMTSIQSQASHHLIQQNPQQIHLRIPTGPSGQRMGMVSIVPKTEDVSVQLSIQVPQQTTQMMSNTTSAQVQQSNAQSVAAAAKLKQMAQHVQQKSHQWVINHSNPNLTQNTIQPINQQMAQQMRPQTNQTIVSNQRIVAQPQTQPQPPLQQQQRQQQVMSPDTQNTNQNQIHHQNQNQNYFTPQMNQQMYWQHNQQQQQQHSQPQHNQHHPQQQMPQQIQQQQNQSQPQQTPPQQLLQQNQQNFPNYWSHPSQMGQIGGQPSQPQQQQTQHYFNNNSNNNNNNNINNNNNNYNYFG